MCKEEYFIYFHFTLFSFCNMADQDSEREFELEETNAEFEVDEVRVRECFMEYHLDHNLL